MDAAESVGRSIRVKSSRRSGAGWDGGAGRGGLGSVKGLPLAGGHALVTSSLILGKRRPATPR